MGPPPSSLSLHDRVRESLLLRARYKAALDAVRQEDAAAK